MNWPDFQRQPRPHPDPYIEGIYQQIDAMKPKDLLTPFKPEEEQETAPAPTKTKAKPKRQKPAILFGGKQL